MIITVQEIHVWQNVAFKIGDKRNNRSVINGKTLFILWREQKDVGVC